MIDSASEIMALGVRPNESKDLSISEKNWIADTPNDFMTGFNTRAPPLEDAWEDASLVI
jgi:hypothetical protein